MSNTQNEQGFLAGIGLASRRDGLIAGVVAALIIRAGIVRIVVMEQSLAGWLLLALAFFLTVYDAVKRRSLFSPPIDGFIIGFGWLFGLLSLLQTFPLHS